MAGNDSEPDEKNAAHDLHLDVLGTSFSITADEDAEYLEEVLNQYRAAIENTRNISGLQDPLKIAVLTGFLLCDEINKQRIDAGEQLKKAQALREGEAREITRRTGELIARIDQAFQEAAPLGEPPPPLSAETGAAPYFYRLQNQIKRYEWGSPEWIPALLGISNPEHLPCAELWMGSHPGAPSLVEGGIELGELIAQNPVCRLGKACAEKYGRLPFLLKLLAAEKPLSIQAHPNSALAREGFERENKAGIPLDDTGRGYKDPYHKPEIICAITSFTGMCGFRAPQEIRRLLEMFLSPAPESLSEAFAPLIAALGRENTSAALRDFLAALFALSIAAREELSRFILAQGDNDSRCGEAETELMRRFAQLYRGDPAVIAPLYLNLFTLEPGEALFIQAGVLHAYIHGFGIELMAASDNVLRGGLTSKRIDVPQLMAALDFCPAEPEIIKPDADAASFRYPAPAEEFSLSVTRCAGGASAFCGNGPAICIVTEGELRITAGEENSGIPVKAGESFFVPAAAAADEKKALLLTGAFTMYSASLPESAAAPCQ